MVCICSVCGCVVQVCKHVCVYVCGAGMIVVQVCVVCLQCRYVCICVWCMHVWCVCVVYICCRYVWCACVCGVYVWCGAGMCGVYVVYICGMCSMYVWYVYV